MKNTLLLSMIDDWLDHLFIVDKRGKTIFFPWGDNKQGYVLKSKSQVAKVKKFYKFSFFICLAVFLIAATIFQHNFWGIIGSMVFSFGGWYLVYYLYISKIVKSLPVAKTRYKDIVLEKLEPEDTEETPQSNNKFPAHGNRPVTQPKSDVFAAIMRIWYRLSPAQLFVAYVFMAVFIMVIWSSYQPHQLGERPTDFLVAFVACLFCGLAGFVMSQSIGPLTKEDWFVFFQWKLPMILIMIVFWGLAVWCLYKFVVAIVS